MPRGAPRTWDVDLLALDADRLSVALRVAGQSAQRARAIAAYVKMAQAGLLGDVPRQTESKYRRIICEALDIPPVAPPPRGALRRTAAVASIRRAAVAAPASVAPAALVAMAKSATPPAAHNAHGGETAGQEERLAA